MHYWNLISGVNLRRNMSNINGLIRSLVLVMASTPQGWNLGWLLRNSELNGKLWNPWYVLIILNGLVPLLSYNGSCTWWLLLLILIDSIGSLLPLWWAICVLEASLSALERRVTWIIVGPYPDNIFQEQQLSMSWIFAVTIIGRCGYNLK